MKFIAMAIVVLVFLSGCTTLTKIEKSPSSIASNIQKGDKIKVVTNDGTAMDIKVKEMSDTSIIGESIQIKYDDIETIEKKKMDGTKTAIVGVAGYLTVVSVMVVVVVFSIF